MRRRITVLRLDHRPERDKRITTHVALVARAFGADEMVYSGRKDEELEKRIADVAGEWGGKFRCAHTDKPLEFAKKFRGEAVHLTFYGQLLSDFMGEAGKKLPKNVLVIVGGSKVPRPFYEVGQNVAVTSQPHSEVAALAVFLHELSGGKEESLNFPGWKRRITPSETGKDIEVRK